MYRKPDGAIQQSLFKRGSQISTTSWGLQVIHFIRHGEGYHNLGHEHLHDPHLTSLGWAQAHALQEHLTCSLPPLNIQVTFAAPSLDAMHCVLLGQNHAVAICPRIKGGLIRLFPANCDALLQQLHISCTISNGTTSNCLWCQARQPGDMSLRSGYKS